MITAQVTLDLTADVAKKIESVLDVVVEESALAIGVYAQESITGGIKSGTVYTSGPSPLPHQASAPGEAPASWTGALAQSIVVERTGEMSAEVKAGEGLDEDYATFLEFGTSRMAPRPFMTPAADAGEKILIDSIMKALEAATV
jgi:HK97 gp10 family phage protein